MKLYASVLSVLIFASLLLSVGINKPFIGQHDWNSVVYGQQAKNYLRYGYVPLKFGATMIGGLAPIEELRFLNHYTPTLPLLISFSYRVFGPSEWSTRIVPIVASLATLAVTIGFGTALFRLRVGIIAGLFMAVTPMFIYYGKNPVHEIVLLPFALLAFWCYWMWYENRTQRWWIACFVSVTIAMLIGWSGYYAATLLAVHGFIYVRKQRKRLLWFVALASVTFGLFVYYAAMLDSGFLGDFSQVFTLRLGSSNIGFRSWFAQEIRYGINLFTATLLGLSGVWLVIKFRDIWKRNIHPKEILLMLSGIFGVAHVVIFRNAGWFHEYLLFPLLPFISVTAAISVNKLWDTVGRYRHGQLKAAALFFVIWIIVAKERVTYAEALLNSEYVRDVYEEAVQFREQITGEHERIVPEEKDVFYIYYADVLR